MSLVTIAIPTSNRVGSLRRAVASALAQDYSEVELVISDNASTDGTETYCREIANADLRVRYVRQPQNVGALRNFQAALDAASGEYFMWLADDDWLEENYLTECIGALDRGVELAAGRPHWFDGDREMEREAPVVLQAAVPAVRVRRYYRTVTRNSVFYGVHRTSNLRGRGPVPDQTGGDWMFVALTALAGPVVTVDTTSINRATGGISDAIMGAGWSIPAGVVRHILGEPTFADLGRARRGRLAIECGAIVGWRVGVWFPLLAVLRRGLGENGYRRLRRLYGSVGRLRSRSEIVSDPMAGQAMSSDGSSQRTPADAVGT